MVIRRIVVYVTAALSIINADEGCQPGAYKFQEFCYTYVPTLKTFEDAAKTCLGRGGHLATIRDHNTARFIRAFHKKQTALSYWIGISDRHSEGNWGYISDSSTLAYTYWNPGEPNSFRETEDCALMRIDLGLAWDDACCCDPFLYICQFEGTSNKCRNNNQFEGKCYELSRQRAIFSEAEEHCQNEGGKLAEIKTMGEQRFLEDIIAKEVWWKNLTDQQMDQFHNWSYVAWIGVYISHGKWIYIDGSKVDQPFWRVNQPSMEANADCVMISDEWISTTCYHKIGSICQFKADIRTTQAVNTVKIMPTEPVNSVAVTVTPTEPVNNVSVKITPTEDVDVAEFPTLIVTITCSIVIIIILLVTLFTIKYRRLVQRRLMSEQQPPPVPMREIRTSFHESRIQSFYSASDGYVIAQEPSYLHPRNDGRRVYDELIDSRRLHNLSRPS